MNLKKLAFGAKARTVRRGAGAFYSALLRNQHLPPAELAALEADRAMRILSFAMEHTEFYRPHYAAHGIKPEDLSSIESWSKIPILDRATTRENSASMHSTEALARNMRDAQTGGSTGEPLRTKHDARVPTLALSWRMYGWWEVNPWDNVARIGRWGFGRFDALKNSFAWWPTKQAYLDAGLFDAQSMKTFYKQIVRNRPALLEGYVGSMLVFADFLESSGRTIPTPVAVATTAAPLTSSVRIRLQEVFGAPVYDDYRGSEFGWMAGECRTQSGLHIFSDTHKVEVVDPDDRPLPPGEVGDIVITDLTNRVFPLIRYRLGDRGALSTDHCSCGISLPLMATPDGRQTDLLRLPSGKVLGHRLMGMFGAHPEAVRLFQIYQRSDYSIVVRVVIGDSTDAKTHVDRAVSDLRVRIDNEVPVTIEYVESLPYTRGKIKYVLSDVAVGD